MYTAHLSRRSVARWFATSAFVLLLVVWIASIWVEARVAIADAENPQYTRYWVSVWGGRVWIGENRNPAGGMDVHTGITLGPPGIRWSFSSRNNRSYRDVIIPLWTPTLLAGVTAAWAGDANANAAASRARDHAPPAVTAAQGLRRKRSAPSVEPRDLFPRGSCRGGVVPSASAMRLPHPPPPRFTACIPSKTRHRP